MVPGPTSLWHGLHPPGMVPHWQGSDPMGWPGTAGAATLVMGLFGRGLDTWSSAYLAWRGRQRMRSWSRWEWELGPRS